MEDRSKGKTTKYGGGFKLFVETNKTLQKKHLILLFIWDMHGGLKSLHSSLGK